MGASGRLLLASRAADHSVCMPSFAENCAVLSLGACQCHLSVCVWNPQEMTGGGVDEGWAVDKAVAGILCKLKSGGCLDDSTGHGVFPGGGSQSSHAMDALPETQPDTSHHEAEGPTYLRSSPSSPPLC